ncbi:MAG: hypothetical protein ABI186_10115 [Candidatus Elarobacter sp.]
MALAIVLPGAATPAVPSAPDNSVTTTIAIAPLRILVALLDRGYDRPNVMVGGGKRLEQRFGGHRNKRGRHSATFHLNLVDKNGPARWVSRLPSSCVVLSRRPCNVEEKCGERAEETRARKV